MRQKPTQVDQLKNAIYFIGIIVGLSLAWGDLKTGQAVTNTKLTTIEQTGDARDKRLDKAIDDIGLIALDVRELKTKLELRGVISSGPVSRSIAATITPTPALVPVPASFENNFTPVSGSSAQPAADPTPTPAASIVPPVNPPQPPGPLPIPVPSPVQRILEILKVPVAMVAIAGGAVMTLKKRFV